MRPAPASAQAALWPRPLDAPEATTLGESIRRKVERLICAFNGFFGKAISELIAEGQSEPDVPRELNEGHVGPRRAGAVSEIVEARRLGPVQTRADPEIVVDAIFGSLDFDLPLKIRPLTPDYGEGVVETCKRLPKL